MRNRSFFIVAFLSSLAIGGFLTGVKVAAQRPERPEAATSEDAETKPRRDRQRDRSKGDRERRNRDGGQRRGPGGRPGGGPGGSGRNRGGDVLGLLRSPEIREELELMPDQVEALQTLEKRMRDQPRDKSDFNPRDYDFRNASEEEKAELFKKIQSRRAEQLTQQKQQLEEVLMPEQMERLEQLAIQVQGLMALGDPQVQKEIGLSSSQVDQLKKIRSDQDGKMREGLRDMWQSGKREDMREKMMEMRKGIESSMLEVLDTNQKEKFESMKGKPFDFESIQKDRRGGQRGERQRKEPRDESRDDPRD